METPPEVKSPLREIAQPFIDLIYAPRALWGINLGYFLEGLVYFGMLTYLTIYFSDHVFQGVQEPDVWSHYMVMVLTAGITISMLVLGFVPDRIGVRPALIASFLFFIAGRALIAGAPTIMNLKPAGLWSPLQMVTIGGILLVVIGYGLYQPAAYAAVRQFTTPKTAAMGFAMLYALMNLGAFLPSLAGFLRQEVGMTGVFWVYTGLTVLSLVLTLLILTPSTVADAIAQSKKDKSTDSPPDGAPSAGSLNDQADFARPVPLQPSFFDRVFAAIRNHPLGNAKFTFFIFCLIPVQTLFAYNWLILPQYIERAYRGGWISQYYEFAANLNPLLVFILVPIVTALSYQRKVYNMMIVGTIVMAFPAFLLALGPSAWTLFSYIIIMTIGEAMWQPRFLQYAAEIAPEGRTGQYMGVAQLPWFLTKVIVPLYSGHLMTRYCPSEGPQDTRTMWFLTGWIAIISPVLLIAAKRWVGRGFKTKHDE